MEPIVEVRELSGGYSPRRPVLHDLTFTVAPGEMVGLIGLNGAGKSTTIRHLLGLMKPYRGTVRIGGVTLDENAERYRRSFAYVPETPLLFDELTVQEHLRLTAMAYGIDESLYNERSERLIGEFRMADKRSAFAAHLSKGMKQKVMIMNALLASPPLYVIDEPFLGLDPLAVRSLLERLDEEKRSGSAILVSSHILSTLESYCDRYLLLHDGRLIVSGTLEALREAAGMPGASLERLFFRFIAPERDAYGT
jgi:ABC-2 type transport system ATP-binding protein